MSITITDLEKWIDSAMKKEGVRKYKLDVSGNSVKGDGYLGEVTFVKITTQDNAKERDIYLVVKSAKSSKELRKQTPVKEAYDREIYMYSKIFPIFKEFQKDCAVESPFHKFPKCYSSSSEETKEALIMENLKMAGFDIHDRNVAQNLNHALFVFRSYGELHAVSAALKIKRPALFRSVTKNMTNVMGNFVKQMKILHIMTKDFEGAIEILMSNGRPKLAEKFDGFKNNLEECLTKCYDVNNPDSIILHGDCWNNNMMFKYEGNNRTQPVDMRFIDFQLSRVASPILDLSYYLYTVADKSVLDHFDFLLQAYHSSFSDSMKEFACDGEDVLTLKQLKEEWGKHGRYGLALTPFILKLVLCQSEEVVDFAQSAESGEGFGNTFNFQLKDDKEYKKRMLDVFSHFAEKFL